VPVAVELEVLALLSLSLLILSKSEKQVEGLEEVWVRGGRAVRTFGGIDIERCFQKTRRENIGFGETKALGIKEVQKDIKSNAISQWCCEVVNQVDRLGFRMGEV
jgi:hypothetical protein